jgi:peptidoglycan/xylan/chitin deacetylase (PgdA/CDA1 family)
VKSGAQAIVILFFLLLFAGSSIGGHQITQWPDNKKGVVSLTFDDNCTSQITLGIPALNARGLRGTFFLITDVVDSLNTWNVYRNMANMGHEIGSHSRTHLDLTTLTQTQLQDEVIGSKNKIDAQITSQKCLTLAYPYGTFNSDVESFVQGAQYIGARGTGWGLNGESSDFYGLNAVYPDQGNAAYEVTDNAEEQGKWVILAIHTLDGGNDCWGSWTLGGLTDYLDYLMTRNLAVVPLGATVKYIKERASAVLAVVSSSNSQIVLSLTDTLDDAVYDEPLTIRSEVPSGWGLVNVQQGSSIITVKSAVEGTATVIYYNSVPDRGLITLEDATTPQITAFNPQSIGAGGGTFVLGVTGNKFATDAVVQWNGSNRATTFVSAAQLQAAITAADIAAPGTVLVAVLNPGGGLSNSQSFPINNVTPTITGLSPPSAVVGGPAFTLTVNGTNFVSGSAVRWNGSNRPTTYVSGAQVTASINAADIAAVGAANVKVFNPSPGGGLSSAQSIPINYPVPAVTGLSPSSALMGGSAFTLTVTGTNFMNGSVVRWRGQDRTTTYVSATKLTASLSAADLATGGTANVKVFNPAPGGGLSGPQVFTINNRIPAVTALNPSAATAGGAAFTLTVTGTNFVSGSIVRWNDLDRTTTYVSVTQLTASISKADIAAAGTTNVKVFNPAPGGGVSGIVVLTVNNPLPTVTALNPTSAVAGDPAFTLTVTGTNFVGSSVVRWNGSARPTTFVSSTQVTASIGAVDIAAVGAPNVRVFSPAPGGGASNVLPFAVNNPVPAVTALSPSAATAGGGAFTLTVTGSKFLNGAVVRWKGLDRTTTYVNATQLTATIGAADIATSGTANVKVFNPAPGGGLSGPQVFTINNPLPTVTSLNPSSAIAGGAVFTLTVNGTNFVNGSVVRWNGLDKTTTFVSATKLKASIVGADIAAIGTAAVTVTNPTPGGGSSEAVDFTIKAHVIGINSGGAAVRAFLADTNFTGGTISGTTQSIDLTGVLIPAPMSVYQTGRFGNFNYSIANLTAGSSYKVALHFAEYEQNAAGKRTFHVVINGTQVLTNFDIFAAVGAQYKAVARSFTVTANSNGKINIIFSSVVGNAIVQGVEILNP